ncbi:MAG: hypothetical protein A3G23_11520 [Bacteroidetes bacterium RIFCSPLOWO2_12_FULL_37_12]|nr:MAG: hypothetical protein A3G23_11520 [Bacteroidetes bacterium RIFCSPLOWO2_12_FULL_37_12]
MKALTLNVKKGSDYLLLLQLAKRLEIDVSGKNKTSGLKKEENGKNLAGSLQKNKTLTQLVGLYDSGIKTGSIHHDKELYGE